MSFYQERRIPHSDSPGSYQKSVATESLQVIEAVVVWVGHFAFGLKE